MAVDIPNVPGVPALPSYSPNNVALLSADLISVVGAFIGPQWGIYPAGSGGNGLSGLIGNQVLGFALGGQAFPYESIVDFDFKQDYPVSDYQQEDGAFQSYDKVQLPFDVKVRISSGGNEFARQALLAAVQAAASTLNLYDVVTPEQTYPNCCITHWDFKRQSHNGVGLILIDLWFVEIRITSTSTFSNTQTPAVAGQQATGNVAAVPYTNAPFSAGDIG